MRVLFARTVANGVIYFFDLVLGRAKRLENFCLILMGDFNRHGPLQ